MKAEEIKKAIIARKIEVSKPVKEAEILGVRGWLFEVSSALMEDWRSYCNAVNSEGRPDYDKRRLAPAKLVQVTFRDEGGNLVFEDNDVALLGGIKARYIDPVYRDAIQINGFSEDGVQSILKNLIATIGEDGLFDILARLGCRCPKCSNDIPQENSGVSGSASSTGRQAQPPKTGGPGSMA